MEFMPKNAPLVVLSFLFTSFVLFVAALTIVHALFVRNLHRAKLVLLSAIGVGGLYLGTLLVFSLSSHEKILDARELKYFCEVDCHLAYSVQNVTTAKVLGAGERHATAAGTFYVVTLRTWFDERTISKRRAIGMPLFPNSREVEVVDDRGRRFFTSLEGMKALDSPQAKCVPLTQSLRPGEFYETTLVFDLPSNAGNPRLLVTDRDPITLALIGHENSFFHKKIWFKL